MNRTLNASILWLGVLFIVPLYAQDSTRRVVIISPRVGSVIDAQEREYFHIFQNFKNFSRAVFTVGADSTFLCTIQYQTASAVKETVMEFSKFRLLSFAEKINHFESLVAGTYMIGDEPTTVQIVGSREITPDEKNEQWRLKSKSSGNRTFPFARLETYKETTIDDFPLIDFGVGFSSYSPDLSGLNEAYKTIENRYRTNLYAISRRNPEIEARTLVWFSLEVHLSFYSSILLETTNGKSFNALSASYLYTYPLYGNEANSLIRLLVGGGIGKYHFSNTVAYNDPIDNEYHYLDDITSRGGGFGFLVTGGLEIGSCTGIRLKLYVSDLYVPPLEFVLPEGVKAQVLLGSFMMGANIEITL